MKRFPAVLLLASALVGFLDATPADLDRIRQRLLAEYLATGTSAAPRFLSGQGDDGTWPDIDYQDRSRSVWKPAVHLDRVLALAAAYRQPKSPLFARGEALDGVHRGLRAWFRLGLKAENWWFTTIGIPQKAMRILVLVDRDLDPTDRADLLALLPDPDHVPPSVATGQNLVWHASEQLVRGVMKPDEADVAQASAFLQKDLRISLTEGIQPDGSFHQHGWQLYNGGYGSGFAADSTFYASVLAGTPWAFTEVSLQALSFYLLEGQRKMIRGLWFDDAARGREPSRPKTGATAPGMASAAARLAPLVPGQARDLFALAEGIRTPVGPSGLPPALWSGNQSYWRSDFMTHSRAGWYASVKMSSGRSIGTELVNGENLGGYWQSFGALRVVRRGDEYADLWPVWDGARIPGTTTPHVLPPLVRAVSQSPAFVGSVSDGRVGLAAMVFDKDGTRARKAWFFFDDGVTAWGTGIVSDSDQPVGTTVNQTLGRGEVSVGGDPARPSWVVHDGTASVFDGKTPVQWTLADRTGSWGAINHDQSSDPVTKPVFTLWIDHGVRPAGASYRYTLLPGSDPSRAAAWASAPPVTVEANGRADAAFDSRTGQWALVFWEPGTVRLGASTLGADRPCLVLWDENSVWVADPTQGTGRLTLTLDDGTGGRPLVLDLPSGQGREGATVAGRWEPRP
jgi:hypothetical protein